MNMTTETVHTAAPFAAQPLPFGTPALKKAHDDVPVNVEQEKKTPEDDVQKIVKEINLQLRKTNTELNFSVDKATAKLVLKIVDSKTHEVIRQIPAEDALRLSSHIGTLMGFLVDDNA